MGVGRGFPALAAGNADATQLLKKHCRWHSGFIIRGNISFAGHLYHFI